MNETKSEKRGREDKRKASNEMREDGKGRKEGDRDREEEGEIGEWEEGKCPTFLYAHFAISFYGDKLA